MAFDELLQLAKGLVTGWNKEKLEKKLQETAVDAVNARIKNAELEEKNSALEDEIRRLKGEKSKPNIKPVTTKELNPSAKKKHKKKPKKASLEIDEQVELDVNKEDLPKDAKFVGKRTVIIQEMVIKRRNIEFIIKRYWSAELGKVIEANVPEEFKGSEFGPTLRSFIVYQYYKNRVPHKKIIEMLSDWGIEISKGTVCSILNDCAEVFVEDLKSARDAGIKKCSQVHIDETGAKFKGIRGYTFGVSNEFFASYTTGFEKNRWAAVGALLGGTQSFLVSRDAVNFVAKSLKKPPITNFLSSLEGEKIYSRTDLEKLLEEEVFKELSKKQLDIIRAGLALGAIRSRLIGSPIKFLITDDAGNFTGLIENHQLCWVHEIRKYKLCEVYKRIESETLEKLIDQWHAFYKLMKAFKNNQTRELRMKVREEFDRICATVTLVKPLDEMLARTRANKKELLLFLKYPQLPLHNNMAEIDIRERVIKRKISFQNRSLEGMKAWDLMLSLALTCRKIKLSFWTYVEDRISMRETVPYLGRVIASL